MEFMRLTSNVFFWHYRQGVFDLLHIWGNFLSLVSRVFSLSDLFKTLFLPWKRLSEPYRRGSGFSLEQFAAGLMVNLMMRLVGFFVRSIFILLSLFFLLFTFVGGFFALLFWILLPLIMVALFVGGVGLLFV